MKKIMIATVLLLMLLSVPVLAGTYRRSSSSGKCLAGGCYADWYNGSLYCRNHKCCIYDCTSRKGSDGMYCTKHHNQYYHEMVNHYRNSSSSGRSSGSRYKSGSSSRRSSIDPDDYDIEGYYEDNRDIYDDYDDAYDGFLDDEDAWDDY